MKKFLKVFAVLGLLASAGLAIAEPVTFIPIYSETVSYTSSEGVTAQAVTQGGTRVRLVCSTACFAAVSGGSTTSATSQPVFLPANIPEYFIARAGSNIIVIRDSSDGSLYVSHMSR